MCLHRQCNINYVEWECNGERGGMGWKIFEVDGDRLYSWLMGACNRPLFVGEWLDAKDWSRDFAYPEIIRDKAGIDYQPGWHIYTDQPINCDWGAMPGYELRRVWFKDVLTTGYQRDTSGEIPCAVARQIQILHEIEENSFAEYKGGGEGVLSNVRY